MDRPPFPMPDEVLIDPLSGYAINIPLSQQNYPGWWKDEPKTVERIERMRVEAGIAVRDGFEEYEREVQEARELDQAD